MKSTTIRTDLIALGALLIVVAAWVALALTHNAVPTWLEGLAATIAPLFIGLAVPTSVTVGGSATDTTTPATASSTSGGSIIDQLDAANALASNAVRTPAVIANPAAYTAAVPVPAPAVVPGRDMTESFPAITAAQVATDKAAQA